MTIQTHTTRPSFGLLARREIGRYLRHKLFWVGGAGTLLLGLSSVIAPTENTSTALDMIAPGALLGILGVFVMTSLVRGSDRTAEAAGAVATSERTRTFALAASVVVPVTTALVWFAMVAWVYFAHPPVAGTVPFGELTDAWVLAAMFATSVMAAAGGPILGLVVARWIPRRGAATITAVLLVLVTVVMQGNFESTHDWRLVWPWTYFYGPIGFNSGDAHWSALPGSPFLYVGYLAALCVLGVLSAAYHDRDHDRRPLLRAIVITGAAAVVLCVLAIMGGLDATQTNPLPAPPLG